MKIKFYFFSFLFFAITNGFCDSLTNVHSWAYQLQGININQIASDTSFELIVIDYSSDGSDATKFSPAQISQIKNSGKKAIAYISIGEAEDYRFYWKSSWGTNPPAFLGPENPDWAGNYKVKFWDAQWQNIVFSYIDTIIQQGFDGIYLDIVDAYYYWKEENPQEPFADTLMINFVQNIRNHISNTTANIFYIIPQNAEDIVNSDNVSAAQKTAYFNAIDAAGVEDVFFYGNLDEDNPYNPDAYRLNQLQEYLQNGKQVFSIEYLTQPAKIQQYMSAADSQNFIPLVCVRNLDQLCSGINLSAAIENNIFSADEISVFPNPATFYSIINFNNDISEDFEITVFSIDGKLIKIISSNNLIKNYNHTFLLNVSDFGNGLYFLEIKSELLRNMIKFAVIK